MNKIFVSFCFLFTFHISLFAQNGTIHGVVLDKETNQPLEYASVSMFRTNDSILVDGIVTKKDGKVSLKIKEGSYFLKTNFIGYKPVYTSGLNVLSNQTIDV